jgi:phenylacetate-CoA ligase
MTQHPTVTSDDTEYEALRRRHVARAEELLPATLERLTWPPERLAAHRTTELRKLLATAREASPWHRARLTGTDIDTVDAADLTALPVMTKDDLMQNFDEIVTDPRLRLATVEDHLDQMLGDSYLFGRYHAAATGGSTGRRAVLVNDWDAWAIGFWSVQRHVIAGMQDARRTDPPPPARTAMVASAAPTHMSATIVRTFSRPGADFHRFPVTRPIEETVAGLNDCAPDLLVGYPSALHVLAAEARAGRLRITPRRIDTMGEVLLPETRALLEETFAVPVGNNYSLSEGGGAAQACAAGAMHLADDLIIVEPVDPEGRPVPPGTRSTTLYLTNLYNHALPLLRYEVTDQIEILPDGPPCPCGCTHRRITDPYGRLDDVFTYGDRTVHPHVFRSVLARHREIVEYQVRQTRTGADVDVRITGPEPVGLTTEIATELQKALTDAGVPSTQVDVTTVAQLTRPASGKLVRFLRSGRATV